MAERKGFSLIEVDDDERFNERAATEKFYATNAEVLVYKGDWFAWDGKCWRPHDREDFNGPAMDVLVGSRKIARHAKAILDHVEMDRAMRKGASFAGAVLEQPDGSILLNVANGVLHITGHELSLLPHDRKYHFIGCLAASYDPDAQPYTWCEYLPKWLPNPEDRLLLQWFCGSLFFPSCTNEIFLLCYGEGGTGKSTVAEGIMSVIEDEVLLKGLSMTALCTSTSYSLHTLKHALVNVGTELDTLELDESANFKRLISGEPCEVRPIYQKPSTMKSTVKLLFMSNTLPRFKHGTQAELRRSRFIGFNCKPPPDQVDTGLKARIVAERDGILSWMIQGLQMILAGMKCPEGGAESRRVKEKFAVSHDPVGYFVKNQCVIDVKAMTPKDEFHKEFASFLESQGFSQKSKEYLYRALYDRVPELDTRRVHMGDKWNTGKVDGVCHLAGYHVVGIRVIDAGEE